MTISYPLTIPASCKVSRINIVAETISVLSTSPYNFKTQVQQHAGTRWKATVTIVPRTRDDGEELAAFLISLKGSSGTFLLGDFFNANPRGAATGTPQVNGSVAAGSNTIATKGWTNSTTNILKSGDMIQIGNRLYKNLTNVNSNGSGQATLDIFPNVRETLTDNTTIITTNAKGLFRLTDNNLGYEIGLNRIYTISLSAVEAI